jgi:hypothetical protein
MPLFRRIEDKHGVDEPGYEPPAPPADDPVTEKRSAHRSQPALWRRIARVVVFILLLAAAWPLFLKNETTIWNASASEIVQGVLLTLLAMAMVGSFGWLIRRIRRSPRTWWQATFTVPVMLITLVLGAGARVGREQERRDRATSEAASAAHTTVAALRTRQDAFVRWLEAYVEALGSHAAITRTEKRAVAIEKESHPDVSSLQREFDRGYSQAQDYRRGFERLPANPQFLDANQNLIKAADYEVAAWRDYAVGLRANDIKRVEHGDAVGKEGIPYLRAAVAAGEAVYKELGGEKVFSGRSDFEHVTGLFEKLRANRGV